VRAVIVRPGEQPEVRDVESGSLRKIVDGYLEQLPARYLADCDVVGYINEEGKILRMEPNLVCDGHDVIRGPIVFLGSDGPEDISLNEQQVEEVLKWVLTGRQTLALHLGAGRAESN